MIDVFGEYVESDRDYAKRIILKGTKATPIHVRVRKIDFDELSLSLDYIQHGMKMSGAELSHPGIYCLFDGYPNKDNCLYVGYSEDSIEYRVYRFMKELCNISRRDGGHPGAKRARLYGKIRFDDIWLKRIRDTNLPKKNRADIDVTKIDEHVASLLKAKFNKRVKHG